MEGRPLNAQRLCYVLACLLLLGAGASVSAQEAPAQPQAAQERMLRLAEQMAGDKPVTDAAPEPAPSLSPLPAVERTPLGQSSSASVSSNPTPPETDSGWVLGTLTALGLVIALILLLRWGWLKMGGRVAVGSSPVVEVLSRTAVAPRNHVLLLRVGGRILVVGDSSAGLRTLASVEDPDEVASLLQDVTAAKPSSISGSFRQLLGNFDRDDELSDRQLLSEQGGDVQEHRMDRARDSLSGLLSRVRTLGHKGDA